MESKLYVIAYDIADTKRRNRLAKELEDWGERVNYSVFECILKHKQFESVKKVMNEIINPHSDVVVVYPMCLDCRVASVNLGRPIDRKMNRKVFSV